MIYIFSKCNHFFHYHKTSHPITFKHGNCPVIFSLKIFKDYVNGVVPQCSLLIPKVSATAPPTGGYGCCRATQIGGIDGRIIQFLALPLLHTFVLDLWSS